ncbi:hypothetical protein [Egicoccus sp. AB-alg2]|uniref:hypothetical protein n=1 Tax=Egicoccus sp. AB-alg2 TaxID=3242693 RepID=UPI00359ECFB4
MRERYVLLGLARARVDWFRAVGHWSTAAALPAEFVRCVSADEVRARLSTGRPFSALLVDAAVPGLDRDLLAAAHAAGCAVLVVDTVDTDRDWRGLGADAVLAPVFSRDELLEVLGAHARPVTDAVPVVRGEVAAVASGACGRLIAVTGPGGTGASTLAIALAQGLATPSRSARGDAARGEVLLADLCRYADQAMLHDTRSLVPGIQEVVELHRVTRPAPDEVRAQTFEVADRGYRLLLGLRRPRHWVALRPRAVEAAVDGLLRAADVVVADVEAEFEGEAETGSVDVEDRHAIARTAIARAEVVVVVGEASMKGCYALVRTLGELLDHGVPVDRLLPVVNRSPRSPRTRAELTTTLATLLQASVGEAATRLVSPLHLPARRVDEALRDGVALPAPLPSLLARAVEALAQRAAPAGTDDDAEPARLAPGSLSAFTSPEPPA